MVVWLIKLVESDYQFSASNSKWKLINNVLERNSLTRIYPGTNGYRIDAKLCAALSNTFGAGNCVMSSSLAGATTSTDTS